MPLEAAAISAANGAAAIARFLLARFDWHAFRSSGSFAEEVVR